ncbi:MAG TPA: lysine exporter LysO family protein [Bacillota bacterium]|nr:lysine exporter LysO family protein [Bacillota bacterium]
MSTLLLGCVAFGVLAGVILIPQSLVPLLSGSTHYILLAVLFGVGLELGHTRGLITRLKKVAPTSLLLPLTSGLGSLLGGLMGGLILGGGAYAGLAIGAGFGWYSLSSVIIADFAGAELAALAFLTNVFREIIAIVTMPVLFRRGFGIAALTPGGATTMDTTLAIVSKMADQETTIIAFYHGLSLSLLVPLLVPLLAARI